MHEGVAKANGNAHIAIERSNATLQTLVSGLPLMTQRQNKYAVGMGQISVKRQITPAPP